MFTAIALIKHRNGITTHIVLVVGEKTTKAGIKSYKCFDGKNTFYTPAEYVTKINVKDLQALETYSSQFIYSSEDLQPKKEPPDLTLDEVIDILYRAGEKYVLQMVNGKRQYKAYRKTLVTKKYTYKMKIYSNGYTIWVEVNHGIKARLTERFRTLTAGLGYII